MAERSPAIKSDVISHLVSLTGRLMICSFDDWVHCQALLEEQLADGREWLMDTETPSLADASVHFVYAWLQGFRSLGDVFDRNKFTHSIAVSINLYTRLRWHSRSVSGYRACRNISLIFGRNSNSY